MTFASRRLPKTGLELSEYGFGAAPVGNLYAPISDAAARETIDAALAAGFRYVDTAPYYGFGLSERRLGEALDGRRQDIVLSTKVGRLLDPAPWVSSDADRHGFRSSMPFEPRFDYSYDGVLRSWEESRARLCVDRIDILYVHDIGSRTHGARHEETLQELISGGGLRALEELRAAGQIAAFGLGVNEWQVCLAVMDHADIDLLLLAGRYTLLEQGALDVLLPRCLEQGTGVVVGGVFNSGVLATGARGGDARYDYAPAPPSILAKVARMEAWCERYGVPLAAAALRFPLAHPAIVSVIPGLDSADRVAATSALLSAEIPDDLWRSLKEDGLLRADAPVPEALSA